MGILNENSAQISQDWFESHTIKIHLHNVNNYVNLLNRFSARRICSRERKIKQRDWLAKNSTVSLISHITEYLFPLLFARTNSPCGKPALGPVKSERKHAIFDYKSVLLRANAKRHLQLQKCTVKSECKHASFDYKRGAGEDIFFVLTIMYPIIISSCNYSSVIR